MASSTAGYVLPCADLRATWSVELDCLEPYYTGQEAFYTQADRHYFAAFAGQSIHWCSACELYAPYPLHITLCPAAHLSQTSCWFVQPQSSMERLNWTEVGCMDAGQLWTPSSGEYEIPYGLPQAKLLNEPPVVRDMPWRCKELVVQSPNKPSSGNGDHRPRVAATNAPVLSSPAAARFEFANIRMHRIAERQSAQRHHCRHRGVSKQSARSHGTLPKPKLQFLNYSMEDGPELLTGLTPLLEEIMD